MDLEATNAPLESLSIRLTEDDITEFARQFDPQPYHLDPRAAEQSIFGALCASGWQVAAITTRLLEDALIAARYDVVYTCEVSSLAWKKPTFVDDQLSLTIRLGDASIDSAPTGHYHLPVEANVVNQNDETVADMAAIVRVRDEVSAA